MINVKTKLEQLINYTDKNGKKLIFKADDGQRVYLEIDGKLKCLGAVLIGEHHILYSKFDDERNIFRKTNAWSINHTILVNVDMIHYETLTHDYLITKERALEFGEFFHFQETTELKVYVPLKYWECRHKGLKNVFPEEYAYRSLMGDSWYNKLKKVMHSEMMTQLRKWVYARRQTHQVYPSADRTFRAFKLCSFEHTKVVILGQCPYHNGSASGLAFAYLEGSKLSIDKSLDIIWKEVERDVHEGMNLEFDYSLESWARQGVLLLNTLLTVDKGVPLSHAGQGWERFSRIVIYELLIDPSPKVFLIWGRKAEEVYNDAARVAIKNSSLSHIMLYAPHPAADLHKYQTSDVPPLYPTTFSGCKHFSKANEFLKKHNRKEIKW